MVDRRNRRGGIWQWAIVVSKEDRAGIAVHTWHHGFLRPVYDDLLVQLREQGIDVQSLDTETDPFVKSMMTLQDYLSPLFWFQCLAKRLAPVVQELKEEMELAQQDSLRESDSDQDSAHP